MPETRRAGNRLLRLDSLEDTMALGRRLGSALREGDVVLLAGPLGAGKTVLVRAIAEGLGSADDVGSPTFVLVRHYMGRIALVHADLYRVEDPAEVDRLGLLELSAGGVLAVEWADRAPGLRGAGVLELRIGRGVGEGARSIEVISAPAHLEAALSA